MNQSLRTRPRELERDASLPAGKETPTFTTNRKGEGVARDYPTKRREKGGGLREGHRAGKSRETSRLKRAASQ